MNCASRISGFLSCHRVPGRKTAGNPRGETAEGVMTAVDFLRKTGTDEILSDRGDARSLWAAEM